MNRDLENEFEREEDSIRSRSRRRESSAGAGADSDIASVRRPRTAAVEGNTGKGAGAGRGIRPDGARGQSERPWGYGSSAVSGSRKPAVGSVPGNRAGTGLGNSTGAVGNTGAGRQPGTEGYGSRAAANMPAGSRSVGSGAGAVGSATAGNRSMGAGASGVRGAGTVGSGTAKSRSTGTGAGRPPRQEGYGSRSSVNSMSGGRGAGTGALGGSMQGSRPVYGTGDRAGTPPRPPRQGSRIYTPETTFPDDSESGGRNGAFGRNSGSSRRAALEAAAADPVLREIKRRRRIIITMIILEIFVLVGIWLGRSFIKKYNLIQRDPNFNIENETNPNLDITKVENMKGYWTVALFGVDSRNNSVGKNNNADVIIICNINQENGEIKLVSVFRDSYLNLDDDGSYNKINQAYFRGGPEQAIKALNKNLDIQIDDYATFNWKAVADAINILGGVDVELSKAEFYYINAFITETVEATGIASQHVKQAGMNHLDGVQAVAYARLRKMDTDFARTERQRKIIQLCFDKLKQADFAVVNNVMEVVFPQILTSVTLNDIIPAAKNLTKYNIAETIGFPMARSDANMGKKGDCVIPQTLESNVVALHLFLFGDENYQPSDMVKKISAKISADSGMYNEGKQIDHVGTDGGYIPKPTTAAKSTEETSTKSTEEDDESEVSTSEIDDDIIDGEDEWDLETDEFGNYVDPPEDDFPGQYPGATRPSGSSRPGSGASTEIPYPGYTTTPDDESNGNSLYPGSTTNSDEVTGPGSTSAYPGSNRSPSTSYPGSTKAPATSYPGSTKAPATSYPGSTKESAAAYPGSTTEEYVPEGPGSVIIGPGA